MPLNQYQTEWIATHLLFPNSAQARDIFLFIVSELKPSVQDDKSKLAFFKNICTLYFKTNLVQSNLSFSDFNQPAFKLWPLCFKKLNKEEILILLGSFYFNLHHEQISEIFRISSFQMLTKINKIIYKIIPKPNLPLPQKSEFKFRKYNSPSSSYFFIFDDVIASVLSNSDIHILLSHPGIDQLAVKKYYDQVLASKNELLNLNQQTYNYPEIQKPQSEFDLTPMVRNKKIYWMGVSAVIIGCLSNFLFKPHFIQNRLVTQKSEVIEIQSLRIDRHVEDKELVVITDSKTTPVVVVQVSNDISVAIKSKIEAPATVKSVIVEKAQAKATVVTSTGGVFRGRLTVTDVQQVIGVVKEKIINLGGKKAGEVELGWMKNDDVSYFHFSLPEVHKDEFQDYLKQFGAIDLVFEPHPRIMSKGIKRYIIEIKQNE